MLAVARNLLDYIRLTMRGSWYIITFVGQLKNSVPVS